MFEDRVWWITGASSGIGAALAESVARAGAKLVLSGRNVEALEAVAARCPRPSLVLPFEVTDFENLPACVEKAWAWGGRIDTLVNNAGISQRSLAVDTSFEVYRRIVEVDLMAPIALTQIVLPRMIQAGGGTLMAISSVAGIVGAPLRSAYSAAKHGLIGYHDSVRAETAHLGIHVLVVAPGSVKTDISKNALDARAKPRGVSDAVIDNGMDPMLAAQRILEALEKGERELVLAEGWEADAARLRRADPNALFDLAARMVADGYARKLGVEAKSKGGS